MGVLSPCSVRAGGGGGGKASRGAQDLTVNDCLYAGCATATLVRCHETGSNVLGHPTSFCLACKGGFFSMRKMIHRYLGRYPPFTSRNAAIDANPAIIGHRGAPFRAPENTPESFAAAAKAGAQWVELDVRRSRDATLIVHHDSRTRDGVPLIELDAVALAERGTWALDDVLVRLPPGLGLNIEVKNVPGEPDYDDEQRIVGLLTDLLGPVVGQRPLLMSSFNPRTVQALAASLAGVHAGLLHGPGIRVNAATELALQVGAGVLCAHLHAQSLDAKTVSAVHNAGLAVMVWVVDDPTDAVRLADAGVDALCTNDPERLVSALRVQR